VSNKNKKADRDNIDPRKKGEVILDNVLKIVLSSGSAMALMIPTGALGQTTASPSATATSSEQPRLDEIIVTASRSETSLQKTAIAVTAMSAQNLRERSISSLSDVSNFVPALSIGTRSGTGSAGGSIAIRGMGVDATDSSAAVGIYVDDVYYASGRGNLLGLLDVDRIEVLRGPQGTLFGRNTIAGAIQYVSHNPDAKLGGYLTGVVGNLGRTDIQGAVNLPVSDSFALRFSGLYNKSDGFVHDNTAGVDRGANEATAARIKAKWTPAQGLEIDLKGEYLHEKSNGRPVLVDRVNPNAQFVGLAQLFGETRPLTNAYLSTNFAPGHFASAGFNSPDYFRFTAYIAQGVIKYQLSDNLTIKSITSGSWYRSRLAQDIDNTPLSILATAPADDDTSVFTQELQLSGKLLENRLKFTLGGYYFDSRNRQNPGQGIVLGLGPVQYPYGNPALNITSKAVYGQASYSLTDQFSLSAGLRYSGETNTSWLLGQTSPRSVDFTNLSPHIGLNFQANRDILLYVKASRGFRAGGISPNAALPNNGLAFAPETAWTYEAGLRMDLLDHKLRLNPTVFMTDWSNIQFNNLVPTASSVAAVTSNAGNARIKGLELEAEAAPTTNLRLTASMAILDAHYTSVSNLPYFTYPLGFLASFGGAPGTTVVLPNIALSTPLQRAPKFKFTIGGRYTIPLANDSRFVVSADYAWSASQASAVTISDQVTLPAYGMLNARVQWSAPGDRFSLALFGTNLTNQYYLMGGVDFAGGYTTGARQLDPGKPRQYGLEARVKF